MGRATEVISALQELHSERDLETCLTEAVNRSAFVIIEDADEVAHITFLGEGTDQDGFSVLNPNRRYISLLATDHCFFSTDDREKKCDFILFDDIYFCFVELKLKAEPRNAKNEIRKKAWEQLGTTIDFFRQSFSRKTRKFFNFELEAYVVMRSHVYPKHRIGLQARRTHFLDQYGVKLFEQNRKEFDQ